MSYIFFEDVLTEIGYKLNFEAIANYAGNSFVEKSWEMIRDSNPLMVDPESARGGGNSSQKKFADFFGGARVATKEELDALRAVRAAAGGNKGNEKT